MMKTKSTIKTFTALLLMAVGGVSQAWAQTDYGTTALTGAKTWDFNDADYMSQLETNVFESTETGTKLSTTKVYDNLFYGTNLYKAHDGWFSLDCDALGFSGDDMSEPSTNNLLALKVPVGVGSLSVTYSTGTNSVNFKCKVGSTDAQAFGGKSDGTETVEVLVSVNEVSDILLYFTENGSNRIYKIVWTPIPQLTGSKTWNFETMKTELTENVFISENMNPNNTSELGKVLVYDNLFIGKWAKRDSWGGESVIMFSGTNNGSSFGENHFAFIAPASGKIDMQVWGYKGKRSAGVKVGTSDVVWQTPEGNKKYLLSYDIKVTQPTLVLIFADNNALAFSEIKYTPSAQTLNFGATGWASFAPSFDCTIPGGVTAYKVGLSETTVTATPVTGDIKANEGILVHGTASSSCDFAPATGAVSALDGNDLIGTGTGLAVAANTYYGLAVIDDSHVGFKKINAGNVGANKAILPLTAAAPLLSIVFADDETTSISEKGIVKSEKCASAPVYNLNGQRVSQPKKGLYIVNGKKVIK